MYDFSFSDTHENEAMMAKFSWLAQPKGQVHGCTKQMTVFKGITNTFDNNGNLTSDGVRTFKYDAFNRIIQVKVGAVVLANYQYDAFNRRVMKKVDADLNGSFETTVKFLYDGFRCIEELNASDALVKEYVWGSVYIDELILQRTIATATDYYFTHDFRYSVTSITDLNGSIVESYDYKVYGERTASGAGLTDVGYTGQRHDSETGLMYFKNRYYSVSMGQFLTRDSLGYVDGLSMYLGYFGGNGNDPFGMEDTGRQGPDGGKGSGNSKKGVVEDNSSEGERAITEDDEFKKWAKTIVTAGGFRGLHWQDVEKKHMMDEQGQKVLRVIVSRKTCCKFTLEGTLSIEVYIKLFAGSFNYKGFEKPFIVGSAFDMGLWSMIHQHEMLHREQIINAYKKAEKSVDEALVEIEKQDTMAKAKAIFNEKKKAINDIWLQDIKNTYAHDKFPKQLASPLPMEDAYDLWTTGQTKARGVFKKLKYDINDKEQHLKEEVFKKEYINADPKTSVDKKEAGK